MTNGLEKLKHRLDNYDDEADKNDCVTRENIQSSYDMCKEVYESIDVFEMKLIWYLRHSHKDNRILFLDAAKQNYEAYQARLSLTKPPQEQN